MLFARDAAELELARHHLAVDGVGHAGERAAAQRQDVGAGVAVREAADVALEHLEVGEQVVRQRAPAGPAAGACSPA